MKNLMFLYLSILFLPSLTFGQNQPSVEKIPDFMRPTQVSVVEKDTLTRICFWFDKEHRQILNDQPLDYATLSYCKVFERKFTKTSRGYLDYESFIQTDKIYKLVAECFKTENPNQWLMKKYKNDSLISENKVRVTDISTGTSKTKKMGDPIPLVRQFMKTEIID